MNQEYLLLTGALRVFNDFSHANISDFYVEHDTKNESFNELRNRYKTNDVAGEGDDFTRICRLMTWVYDNVLHNGGTKDVDFLLKNSISILNYSNLNFR